jgi:hypothetical protein
MHDSDGSNEIATTQRRSDMTSQSKQVYTVFVLTVALMLMVGWSGKAQAEDVQKIAPDVKQEGNMPADSGNVEERAVPRQGFGATTHTCSCTGSGSGTCTSTVSSGVARCSKEPADSCTGYCNFITTTSGVRGGAIQ